MQNTISSLDSIIIISYLAGILAIGLLSVRLKKMNSEGYFLSGRGLNWIMVGAALFASNISTIHLVELAASGYNEGLVWGIFEWLAAISLIMPGLIFAPFYFKSKIATLPEFLEKRYDSRSRTIMAFIAIIDALFVHIGMHLAMAWSTQVGKFSSIFEAINKIAADWWQKADIKMNENWR